MSMVNVDVALTSPYLTESFRVTRTTGNFGRGGWIPTLPAPQFTAYGIVNPATEEDLQQVPEADRIKEVIAFATKTQIFTTRGANGDNAISDVLTWDDNDYRVIAVLRGKNMGLYRALATRMAGN